MFRNMSFDSGPRELRTATELRALAHPLRARLLEFLMSEGPLTASQCAERTGESAANCSWHLRQLAKYDFVEEAGGGVGRQRPWRAVHTGIEWHGSTSQPELASAGQALEEVWLDHQIASYQGYLANRGQEPASWRAAAMTGQSLAWLTVEELADIGREFAELLTRHLDRVDPAKRPAAARLVRLVVLGFPATSANSANSANSADSATPASTATSSPAASGGASAWADGTPADLPPESES